ncbi:MAG: NAD(P)/FAD-dependent oxidoreductase [Ferruginibacter sp.]
MEKQISNTIKQVVIIGGGFAGTNFAKRLAKDNRYHITLVDKNNYYFFPPLVYQVATGFLETSSISYPFRKLFRKAHNVHFRLGTLTSLETATNTCYLDNGELRYDYLVFATGAEPNYFGNENIKNNAIPMKTINDALQMRNTLLQNLEKAAITKDIAEREKLSTIVIAGGGPTGVEVAGMLAELRKYILKRDYPELFNVTGDIYLVEGSGSLLVQMSKQSHRDAENALVKLDVKIKLNTQVKDFINDTVYLSSGETIETKNLIWTAGVNAIMFKGIPAASIGKGKRMLVDAYNKVEGLNAVYAIGDACLQTADKAFPAGHPQLAQVAIQQGKNLATNFSNITSGKPLNAFTYFDKGTMAIIGRNKAVVDLPKPVLHFKGFIALFIWLFIHLISLVTYRNKMRTLYNWIIAYFTRDQSLRMIIRPEKNKSN